MLGSLNENELCAQMIELELLIEYRNYNDSLVLAQKILQDHPGYLPAKEALHQVYRLTGQSKRAQHLQREIDAHVEVRAKESLSDSAKEELANIEGRKFAERTEQLTKVIYQGRNIEEILQRTAQKLLDELKSDRCHIYLADEGKQEYIHYEYHDQGAAQSLDPEMEQFVLDWLQTNAGSDSPAISAKMQEDSSFSAAWPLLVKYQVHSMLGFPLNHKSSTIGYLAVQQCVSYYTWNDMDLSLLSSACGHLATAIRNLQSLKALQDKAYQDKLTGLYNRHFLEERLSVELANSRRLRYPLCLCILDIDHFKEINDNFGHAAGDSVLMKIAFLIRTNVRKSCIVARWGGEEFLVVFPRVELVTAFMIMEQLRQKVCQTLEIEGRYISISAGIVQASLDGSLSLDEVQSELIKEADNFLYQAKQNGRNQVIGIPPVEKIHNSDCLITTEGCKRADLLTEDDHYTE